MFYILVKDNKIFGCGECKTTDEDILNIEVDEDLYHEVANNLEKYKYSDGEIIVKPDYEAIVLQEQRETRTLEIKSQLVDLDAQAVRPLRAILTDCGTDEDREILKGIEIQATSLRNELQLLGGEDYIM